MNQKPRKLKRAIIKEELVALTGDATKALVLNQFIYWSERVKDFDQFVAEEISRAAKEGQQVTDLSQSGWIYKTADEMANEIMISSSSTISRHIKTLVQSGWLEERNNPLHKWDRTKQYRVDIVKIQKDLLSLGYTLEGYSLNVQEMLSNSNLQNAKWRTQIAKSKNQIAKSKRQNERAIPETITNITTDITTTTTTEQIEIFQEEDKNQVVVVVKDSLVNNLNLTEDTANDVATRVVKETARYGDYRLDDFNRAIMTAKNSNKTIDDLSAFLISATKNNWSPVNDRVAIAAQIAKAKAQVYATNDDEDLLSYIVRSIAK